MKKWIVVSLLMGLASMAAVPAVAASSLQDKLSNIKKPLVARTDQGVIRSIDLEKRTAMIGGFLYDFGPRTYPCKVTMLNSSAGAVELLRNGMKVEVEYLDLETSRLAVSITQLSDSAKVEY